VHALGYPYGGAPVAHMSWSKSSTLADLESQGYDQLAVHCTQCRTHTAVWFLKITPATRDTLGDIARRLPCPGCGRRPDPANLVPERQDDASGVGEELSWSSPVRSCAVSRIMASTSLILVGLAAFQAAAEQYPARG
jgi:hypothetical protein